MFLLTWKLEFKNKQHFQQKIYFNIKFRVETAANCYQFEKSFEDFLQTIYGIISASNYWMFVEIIQFSI